MGTRPTSGGSGGAVVKCTRGVVTAAAAVGLVVLGAHAASAASTTLYVDRGNASCTDAGPGTATAPFCTIGAAALKAVAGTTVQVAAGTYPEMVTVKASGTAG